MWTNTESQRKETTTVKLYLYNIPESGSPTVTSCVTFLSGLTEYFSIMLEIICSLVLLFCIESELYT